MKLYVLYDRANDHVVRFEKNGDMVIYGEYNEALEDCRGNEEVIKCTDLPIHWKNELLKQTSKTLGCDTITIDRVIDLLERFEGEGCVTDDLLYYMRHNLNLTK